MRKINILSNYRQKRNFTKTTEPYGKDDRNMAESVFVIQEHAASHLHYDFRLEIGGVLVSWAVPKGPSDDPKVKRLAIRTEDHPLEYADFEGEIPAGQYGAGQVQIWDTGTYQNKTEKNGQYLSPEEALEHGHIVFWLNGKKLQGGYALTRMGPGKDWLLSKTVDVKEKVEKKETNIQVAPALNSVLADSTK